MSSTVISLLCGVGGMFGFGIYDFLAGVYSKKIGPYITFFWTQLLGLFFVLLLSFTFSINLNVPVSEIILLTIAAIVYSAGYLFFFKGFEKGNVSIVAVILNLWAVFSILIAYIFMDQRLSPLQSLGAFLIIFGASMASLNLSDIKVNNFQLSSGVKEAALGAFFFGVYWCMSEVLSERIGWLSTTLLVKAEIILFFLPLAFLIKRELYLTNATAKTWIAFVLMGFLEAGAVAIINFGLTIGDAILITPIASALSVVTITLAIVILKERVTKTQGLGMITAVSGIIITGL